MLIFQREIEAGIKERLFKRKAILIFGPRQAGKTTLAKKLLASFGEDGAYFNCELAGVRARFALGKPELLHEMIAGKRIAVFDEAQTIQDIGAILKTFIDTFPDTQIIATGSSSFDLANKINEPLTGRAFEFILYPLSVAEIRRALPRSGREDALEWMRLGTYPAVIAEQNPRLREDTLKNLATNYLYKNIYTFESIRNPRVFEDLIKLLAHQVGSLVSVNELANALGISRATVEKYIRLLEQSYVIAVIRPFSRNPRNELRKAMKIYFIDVGVRNAVIDNVSPVAERSDKGALFENLFVSERLKISLRAPFSPSVMFWRNRTGGEVDVIEASGDSIAAYECKWSKEAHPPLAAFVRAYPSAKTRVVTPEDLLREYSV